MCVLVVTLSLGARTAVQDAPDFSGSWILESATGGADAPHTLSISQTLVRANVRGEPMKPFFRNITFTASLEAGTRVETYDIGVIGGSVVSGDAGRGVSPVWSLDSPERLRLSSTTRSAADGSTAVTLIYRRQ